MGYDALMRRGTLAPPEGGRARPCLPGGQEFGSFMKLA